jgi:hypothetical protein
MSDDLKERLLSPLWVHSSEFESPQLDKEATVADLNSALAYIKALESQLAEATVALDMVRILANTPPNEWRSRSEIHAELAEFRNAALPKDPSTGAVG